MDDDHSVVDAYSERARQYDAERNLHSCWEHPTTDSLRQIRIAETDRLVVDIGCGTGRALETLIGAVPHDVQFVGVEPAANMRDRATIRLEGAPNVRVVNGRFEHLPIDSVSVDYLYSIMAFHWTTDIGRSVDELARVLRPDGRLDIFFTGRHTGREFTQATNPILLKYLGAAGLLQSAKARKHLTVDQTTEAFARVFEKRVVVTESRNTHYDDLDGHWSWWVSRAAGHFTRIPEERRDACDAELRQAIGSLDRPGHGIPYTVHLIHVRVGG